MARDRKTLLRLERAIYARVVTRMDYADPSALVYDLSSERARRYSSNELVGLWKSAALSASADAAWNLYVHVPYCKSLCDFCNYKRLRISSRAALDEYVAFVENEARLFGPALRGVQFGGLYVGGGTPSVLAADQLERLFAALFDSFSFRAHAQKNFEFDPMVMTEDRYQVVERFGFTRFSFGVQSVDVNVNRLHNRGSQNRDHLTRQFDLLKRHGAVRANVDFLLGLSGTTPEQMLGEIEQVMAEFRPQEVTIYFLFPTSEYVNAHFGGEHERFRAFLEPFEQKVPPRLRELASKLEYSFSGDGQHVITLSSRLKVVGSGPQESFYSDIPSNVHRPLNVLGLGDSARSRIFGSMLYKADHDHGDHDPDATRYVGVDTSLNDEMFAYIALVLRDGDSLSRARFQRTFGGDPLQLVASQLQKLVDLGVAEVAPDRIVMRPQSREERLRDLLFFLPPERRGSLEVSADGAHTQPRR